MNVRLGISSGACTDVPILDMLPALHAARATAVEIGTPPRHFDPWQETQVHALGDGLRRFGLTPVSIHAPFGGALDLADPNPRHRHTAIAAILMAASALLRLGGRKVIVHPSDLERAGRHVSAHLDYCAGSLRTLADNCRSMGATLVVESPLPHLIGGHPDEFASLLARLDDRVEVCLDTGHTSLGNHWQRFVEVAGPRLTHVHANDNHGQWDDHLPPGDGSIDWSKIAESLASVQFDGWVMLELACPSGPAADYFQRALQQAQRIFHANPVLFSDDSIFY